MARAAAAPGVRPDSPGVAILQVDTDRRLGTIDRNIYGQFLEDINHSVVDGLFAEQIRGAGFEGTDFETYWTPFGPPDAVRVVEVPFERGAKSVRMTAGRQPAGIRQGRVFSSPAGPMTARSGSRSSRARRVCRCACRREMEACWRIVPLRARGSAWQEVPFSFASARTDRDAAVEIAAAGRGAALVDFVSLMRADVRTSGMLRPDLLAALRGLAPAFIRWPGGSFASTYKWQDGIGPLASRVYHPNEIWGGYSDYYGFGTDEYLELTRQLGADPMIVLPAPDDSAGIGRVRDELGALRQRSADDRRGGRCARATDIPTPYGVRYFQIDNEPMNNGFTRRALRGHRQSLRRPAAADRARGRDRRLRSEALERHGVEREGDRPGREQLRRARRAQLRVRERSLRDPACGVSATIS